MIVSPLRKCRICGLEAKTTSELDLFAKCGKSRRKYLRQNLCKKCANTWRTKKQNELLSKKQACYFCGSPVNSPICKKNEVEIHSLDGNHNNWDFENKVPSHALCHLRFHDRQKVGPKNGRWKGNQISDRMIRKRERYRQKHGIPAQIELTLEGIVN